jgi:Domain of unknown function (DUF6602)
MDVKPDFESLFAAAALELKAAFQRATKAIRPDEKGGPREQQLRTFLAEWLPQKYGVSHGYCIDAERRISRQCDVLLYDALGCPKYVQDRSTDRRLIPYSSTYGMIEVKSTLNENELNDALNKIQSLKQVRPTRAERRAAVTERWEELTVRAIEIDRNDGLYGRFSRSSREPREEDWPQYKVKVRSRRTEKTPPFSFVFAYRLGKGFDSLEQVARKLGKAPSPPDGVCVLGRGILLRSSSEAVRRYKSIKRGEPLDPWALDSDVLKAAFDNFGSNEVKYLVEEVTENKVVVWCTV